MTYRIIDEQGNKIGVPIKASDFYNKPTLKFFGERFAQNETARQPHKTRVKNAIDLALLRQPNQSLGDLMKSLDRQGINTVLRQNEQGIIYGITYVDHQTKCVFNGSALGKQYSAKGIVERCGVSPEQVAQKHEAIRQPNAQNPRVSQVSEHDLSLHKKRRPEYFGNTAEAGILVRLCTQSTH